MQPGELLQPDQSDDLETAGSLSSTTMNLFERAMTPQAQFISRDCIACYSSSLTELGSGSFHEEPLRSFIANDPWGENPLPHLERNRWSYVRCNDCGQSFHRYILDKEWNEIRFSRWMTAEAIKTFEDAIQTPKTRFEAGKERVKHVLAIEKLTRAIRSDERVRVLDFGCGDGHFLMACALHGFEVLGVDRSAARRGNCKIPVVADISDIRGQVHAVTLFEVLEHLDDPRSVLEKLREHLVTGGILVLETPDASGVTGIANRRDCEAIFPLDHLNGFTPETVTAFAVRLGFKPIARPVSQVNCELVKSIKTEAKRTLSPFIPKTTRQYFRKL